VVTLLILIPLAYNDHLPDFHWKSVAVGPPLRRVEPKPIPVPEGRAGSGLTYHRPFVYVRNNFNAGARDCRAGRRGD
jgi:hypothetical protein